MLIATIRGDDGSRAEQIPSKDIVVLLEAIQFDVSLELRMEDQYLWQKP